MKKVQSQNSKHSFGGGYLYNLLNKDIKELNTVILSLFIIIFLVSVGFISYKINNSYALFSDEVTGKKTIEVQASFEYDKTFDYTGDVQEYTVLRNGYYYIEMAGAAGGTGSKGAKLSGYIKLNAGEKLYFYIGKQGTEANTNCRTSGYEFNGGGIALPGKSGICGSTGGGATDVRLTSGSWDDTKSLISRIMVAGAGGGTSDNESYTLPNGGTLYGTKPIFSTYQSNIGYEGTQIAGGQAPTKNSCAQSTGTAGSFGKGGYGGANSATNVESGGGAGGGSGYYGGSGASGLCNGTWPGGGGSSYISGYAGVNSVENNTTITHTNQTIHYSGKYFIGAEMIEGQNSGDGYAKISFVDTKPKRKNTTLNNVRYIKDCISYNTRNNYNHWGEIQAIKDGVNIAKGKTVTGTTSSSSSLPYTRITDGDITYSNYAQPSSAASNQCVTVDLGQTYDLDEVALWNYFEDPRRYISNNFQVSKDNSTWTNLSQNEVWLESSNGVRYNAYIDHMNGYVGRTGLMSWFDGYSNTGTTRNNTTTTWKDLASTSTYKGTIKGSPVWYDNYLYFDGVDDWVQLSQMNYANPTIEVVFKKDEYTTGPEEAIVANYEGGGYGLSIANQKLISEFYISGAYHNIYKDFVLNKKVSAATNYDNSKTNLYTNGTLYDSSSITGSIGTPGNSTPMAIAANPRGTTTDSNRFFKGNIYSVRIYNKALTQEEIHRNYLYDKQKFNLD